MTRSQPRTVGRRGGAATRARALGALAAGLATVLPLSSCAPVDGGADRPPPAEVGDALPGPVAYGLGVTVRRGESFTEGLYVLDPEPGRRLRLVSVTARSAQGVEVLGAALLPPSREDAVAVRLRAGWPPPALVSGVAPVPFEGAEVTHTRAGWEVLVGYLIERDAPAAPVLDGLVVTYEEDGVTYTQDLEVRLALCVTDGAFGRPCRAQG